MKPGNYNHLISPINGDKEEVIMHERVGIYIHATNCSNMSSDFTKCNPGCNNKNIARDKNYRDSDKNSIRNTDNDEPFIANVSSSLINGILTIYYGSIPLYIIKWDNIKSVITHYSKPNALGNVFYYIELAGDKLVIDTHDKWVAVINEIHNHFKQQANA
jgi:hypothetical protein